MSRMRAIIAGGLSLFISIPIGYAYQGKTRAGIVAWCIMIFAYFICAAIVAALDLDRVSFCAVVALLVVLRVMFSIRAALIDQAGPPRNEKYIATTILTLVVFLSMDILSVFACHTFVLGAFVSPTNSMYPTVRANDRFTASLLFSVDSDIAAGRLVIVPVSGSNVLVVRRVIAIAGQHVRVDGNDVYVDGELLVEPYAHVDGKKTVPAVYKDLKVGAGKMFVMGDNRDSAMDSRTHGPVPIGSVYGIPTNVFWSHNFEVESNDPYPPKYIQESIAWERIGVSLRQ